MKNIEWTDITLNAVVGCPRGCPYCYAKKINDRFKMVKDFNKPEVFQLRLEKLNKIKNKKIFMNSMSDIAYWEDWIVRRVGIMMEYNNTNEYYFLTKSLDGQDRLNHIMASEYPYSIAYHRKNVFIGLTITTQKDIDNYNNSLFIYKLLNIEPILERIDLNIKKDKIKRYCKKIILGAETGNRKNKVIPEREWIENIINFCKENNIELFLKENIKKYLK